MNKLGTTILGENEPGGSEAKNVASHWVDGLARYGYAVRGLLYITVGLLAVGVALGTGGETTDKNGAIAALGEPGFGKVLLLVIAIGLAGYSLWGFVRAFFDPLDRGTGLKGLAVRAGYVVSGLAYGALILPTVRLLVGAGQGEVGADPEVLTTAWLMSLTFGRWFVGIAGLIGMGGGLGQFYEAVTAGFEEDFKRRRMGDKELKSARRVGRIGHAARGVVFVMLGFFLFLAAWRADPNEAGGLDEALFTLTQQPYGPWLLGVVALGLVAFGIYSILAAKWIQILR